MRAKPFTAQSRRQSPRALLAGSLCSFGLAGRIGAAVLACAVATAPASAQDAWTGSRLPGDKPGNVVSAGVPAAVKSTTHQAKATLGTKVGLSVATCVASRAPRPAERAILAADEAAHASALREMMPVLQTCMSAGWTDGPLAANQMRLKSSLLDGLVAQSLLRRTGASIALGAQAPVAAYQVPWASESADAAIVDEMAVCVAAREPAAAREIIWSDPDTQAEGDAFAHLSPALGSCLRANATLKANRLGIRAAIARAYFVRTQQPITAAQGTK